MPKSLREVIQEADAKHIAIGHFNISDIAALKAIFEAAKELNVPVVIGVSEGERDFIDIHEAVALVKGLREEFGYPIYLNADHTYSLEKVKQAVEAGVDSVIFDGAKLPFAENVAKTKEVVEYVKSEIQKQGRDILVEGELGYIGQSSKILKELPAGAALSPEMFTKPEEAAEFVKQTGIDMLAPAVGNIHGMLGVGMDPALDIPRIAAIRAACGIPLVLHGGSGSRDEEFVQSAKNGMAIIHINTEIRKAWREGMESTLKANPDEVTPYKLLAGSVAAVKAVVMNRLKLFSGMQ